MPLRKMLASGARAGHAPSDVRIGTARSGGRRRERPPTEEADPAEVAIGERLFLETRFAQHFFANSGGGRQRRAAAADPVWPRTQTTEGALPGPFAGESMNCRACHLVDEHRRAPAAAIAAYADFARRSPIPDRDDGRGDAAQLAVARRASLAAAGLPAPLRRRVREPRGPRRRHVNGPQLRLAAQRARPGGRSHRPHHSARRRKW